MPVRWTALMQEYRDLFIGVSIHLVHIIDKKASGNEQTVQVKSCDDGVFGDI